MRLRRGSRSDACTDIIEGPEPSRVWPLLLLGSGETAAGGAAGGGEVAPRELRGLNSDANIDRRRFVLVPDCSVDVRPCVGDGVVPDGGDAGEAEMGAGSSFRITVSYAGASSR